MPGTEENTLEQVQEQTDGWDKDRQKLDQLSANVTKIAGEKAELASQLTAMRESSQSMQDTVARLETQLSSAQAAREEYDNGLDSDMYDEKLIQTINSLKAETSNVKKQLAESNAKIRELDAAKTQFERNAENERELVRKAERKETILTDLDSEFGAKFRNEALKLAQADVDASGVAPSGDYAVAQLLRKHYKALSANPGTVTKVNNSIPVDTGEGGVVFAEGEIEEGSRDDVMSSIRNKFKGRPFTMPKV